MGNAAGRLLTADNFRNFFFQPGVKRGCPANTGRKACGILDKSAAESLHMKNCGNMMLAVSHHNLLNLSLPRCRFLQRFHAAHFQGTDLTDSIFCLFGNIIIIKAYPVKRENTVYLSHLLFQAHFF